jgi:hypothetical protein
MNRRVHKIPEEAARILRPMLDDASGLDILRALNAGYWYLPDDESQPINESREEGIEVDVEKDAEENTQEQPIDEHEDPVEFPREVPNSTREYLIFSDAQF